MHIISEKKKPSITQCYLFAGIRKYDILNQMNKYMYIYHNPTLYMSMIAGLWCQLKSFWIYIAGFQLKSILIN